MKNYDFDSPYNKFDVENTASYFKNIIFDSNSNTMKFVNKNNMKIN